VQQILHGDELLPRSGVSKNNSSSLALAASLKKRMHVYLIVENKHAGAVVQAAAVELGLRLYHFDCSPRTKQVNLSRFHASDEAFLSTKISEAYTKGGLFWCESVEKAPRNFQFWLNSWIIGRGLIGSNFSGQRHPNFVVVLTSPVRDTRAWSGRLSRRLVYVNMMGKRPHTTA
jgi:hypothetical protein